MSFTFSSLSLPQLRLNGGKKVSGENFDRKEGDAHHLPRRAHSAEDVSVEVCQVNISRREITEVDDSIVITGIVRFCMDWEQTFRFTWSNLHDPCYIHERLQLFEMDLTSSVSRVYLDEALDPEHPLLGFVPLTGSEMTLQMITDDLRNDFAYIVSGNAPYQDKLVWDTCRLSHLITGVNDGLAE